MSDALAMPGSAATITTVALGDESAAAPSMAEIGLLPNTPSVACSAI
jgi:hypothetical protein